MKKLLLFILSLCVLASSREARAQGSLGNMALQNSNAVTIGAGTIGTLRITGNTTNLGTISGGTASLTLSGSTGLPIATGVSGLGTGVETWLQTPSSANLAALNFTETGTPGGLVFSISPALVTPDLGTPSALVLTNATGLPIAGITGLGTGWPAVLATGTSGFVSGGTGGSATPGGNSGQIQYNNAGAFGGIATTGSGVVVLGTSGTLTTPTLAGGTASGLLVSGGTGSGLTLASGTASNVLRLANGTGTSATTASIAWSDYFIYNAAGGTGVIFGTNAGAQSIQLTYNMLGLAHPIGWTSSGLVSAAKDTYLWRQAAGTLAVGTSATTTTGSLVIGSGSASGAFTFTGTAGILTTGTALSLGATGTAGIVSTGTAHLVTPNVSIGHSVLAYGTAINISFARTAANMGWRTVTATGDLNFTGSDYPATAFAESRGVIIIAGTAARAITVPGWRFIGSTGTPSSIAANKIGLLSLTATGTAASSVIGSFSSEP